MKLAAMLPGAVLGGTDALRAGHIVPFDSVATELGHAIKGERPTHIVNRDALEKMFNKDDMRSLLNSGHFRTMHGLPFLCVHAPQHMAAPNLNVNWTIETPARMPWE